MEWGSSGLILFCLSLALIAAMYGSVGQAGASGFVALMALFSFAPDMIKPTALTLNVLVSGVVAWRFARAGHVSWSLIWPFLVGSMPAALVGGYLTLPAGLFNMVLGGLLLIAGMPFFIRNTTIPRELVKGSRVLALLAGGIIGLVSGLTGMGGGVLLAPLLIYCRWAEVQTAAAASAVFILLNSLMALLGYLGVTAQLPPNMSWFAAAAVLGGFVGARLGSVYLSTAAIHRILGGTLVIAGIKLTLQV